MLKKKLSTKKSRLNKQADLPAPNRAGKFNFENRAETGSFRYILIIHRS